MRKKESSDRASPGDVMLSREILLFDEFRKRAGENGFTPEEMKKLEEEFEVYVKNLWLPEDQRGKLSPEVLFDQMAGNAWVIIRRDFLEPAIKRRNWMLARRNLH